MASDTRTSDGVAIALRDRAKLAESQRSPAGSALLETGLIQSRFGRNTKYAVPAAFPARAGTWSAAYPSPFGKANSPRTRIVGDGPNSRGFVRVSVDCAVSPRVVVAALRTACSGSPPPPQPASAESTNAAVRNERTARPITVARYRRIPAELPDPGYSGGRKYS